MMKIIYVFIVMEMLVLADAAVCAGKDCEFRTPDLDPEVYHTATEIARKI